MYFQIRHKIIPTFTPRVPKNHYRAQLQSKFLFSSIIYKACKSPWFHNITQWRI